MKISHFILATIISFIVTALLSQNYVHASATLEPAHFVLGSDPKEFAGSSHCAIRTKLTLDQTELLGPVARLENYVEGFCEIAVDPNVRFYELTASLDECHSTVLTGKIRVKGEVSSEITITDHRTRTCRDVPIATIITEETTEASTEVLYSLKEAPQVTCQAYFTGYFIDPFTKSCKQGARSGCSNPFKFHTLNECTSALERTEVSAQR